MYLTDENNIFSKIIPSQTHTRLKTMDIGKGYYITLAFLIYIITFVGKDNMSIKTSPRSIITVESQRRERSLVDVKEEGPNPLTDFGR